jgi:hypothetical protein
LDGDQPAARPPPTHRTPQAQNKGPQTSMHPVGFKPTTPVLKQAKTVHALDRAATMTGTPIYIYIYRVSQEEECARLREDVSYSSRFVKISSKESDFIAYGHPQNFSYLLVAVLFN